MCKYRVFTAYSFFQPRILRILRKIEGGRGGKEIERQKEPTTLGYGVGEGLPQGI